MEKGSEQKSKNIGFIVHDSSYTKPILHLHIEDRFIPINSAQIYPHFWCFEIDDLSSSDTSLAIYQTPISGESTLLNFTFFENQKFVFIDLTEKTGLIPYNEFYEFFTQCTERKFIDFSDTTIDPIQSLKIFLKSFNDNYFIWALAFISQQPWCSLFLYNEQFSTLLLELSIPFIERNFFIANTSQPPQVDLLGPVYETCDIFISTKPHIHPTQKYRSFEKSSDIMMSMIEAQLGDIFAYIFSTIIDFSQDFPFTSYVPPLTGNHRYVKEADDLFNRLFNNYLSLESPQNRRVSLERLFFTCFATYTETSTLDLDQKIRPLKDQPDFALLDLILKLRMYESQTPSRSCLAAIKKQLPGMPFASTDAIVPPEWMPDFFAVFEPDRATMTEIAAESFRLSVPSHIASQYANTTQYGAIVMEDCGSCVLMPGAVVQRGSKIGANTMLMARSVAMAGSVLADGAYAGADCVVVPTVPAVAPSARIEGAVKISKGVTVLEGAVVRNGAQLDDGCVIGAGAVVSEGCRIGAGAYVEDGEVVPPGFIVPIGFRYEHAIVENCNRLPQVLSLRGARFTRQKCGILCLQSLLRVCELGVDFDPIFGSYLKVMAGFPIHTGKEISELRNLLPKSDLAAKMIAETFKRHTLSLALAFYNSLTKNILMDNNTVIQKENQVDQNSNEAENKEDNESNKVNEKNSNENWVQIITEACTESVKKFEVALEDFEKADTADFLLNIARNSKIFIDHGVDSESIINLKSTIFETCDELSVRLSLVTDAKKSSLSGKLSDIISLTMKDI